MATAAASPDPLAGLAAALEAEREALIGHDVDALMRSTEAKLAALRAIEASPPRADEALRARFAELAELNRANGVLLARRRRAVNFALRQLGRSDPDPGYDARGHAPRLYATRMLAVA